MLAFPDKLNDKLKKPLQQLYQEAELKVTGGHHTGAWLAFPAAELRIGSALMNDIALMGDAVAPHHARLRLSDAMGQKLIIEALEGDVIVNQADMVQAGQTAEVSLPVQLQMAGAALEISPRTLSPGGARWAPKILVGLFGLLGLLLFGSYWSNSFSQGVRQYKRNPPAQMASIQAVPASSAAPDAHAAVARSAPVLALAAVRSIAEQAGLKEKITLTTGADGSFVANGTLDPSDAEAWRSVLRGIDDQKFGRPVINNVVVDTATASVPAIASIWFGKVPHIITKAGEVAGVGDKLTQNWRVVSIDNGVVLDRNGRIVRITH